MREDEETEEVPVFIPSPIERKLLDILLNPEHRFKSVTDICLAAGTSRKAYYRAFEREGFADYYRGECEALVHRAIGPVVNACVREAVAGSAAHAKMVLGMAGMYSEKTDHRILDKNGEAQDVGGVVFYIPTNGREKKEEDVEP